MNSEKEMITMEKNGEWFDIKMGINSKVQRVTNEAVKAIREGKPKIRNPNMFDSFYKRGKYQYIKYSYDRSTRQMILHIHREYYHRVLSNRTHDLAIFAKNISIVWDQYSGQVEYFLKNII